MRTGIALGSNLGDRLAQLRRARAAILALPDVSAPVLASRIFETEPVDTEPDANAFLNAVLELEFSGEPAALLAGLQAIEAAHGRPSHHPRNASRSIDLDILYVGNLTLTEAGLAVPHPRLHLRRFVLAPLCDIRPELMLPSQPRSIAEQLASLRDAAKVELFAADWDA